jgi:hypothetical protein
VKIYLTQHRALPTTLTDLVVTGTIPVLPEEPFGGHYRLDPETGTVTSSTHPERLRTFFKRKQPPILLPKIEPAYVFPRAWE